MTISVGGLLGMGHLGCELIAGAAGIERRVCWAHVCELEDPVPWLEGGELVMTTGLAIPRSAAGQTVYLERLATSRAAGLAISKDLHAPPLSSPFLSQADRLAFPVLSVSIEVPFIAIARVVNLANGDESQRQLVRQLAIFDALRSASDPLSDLSGLFARLASASGYDLFLSSPSGAPFLLGVPEFPGEHRHLLDRPPGAPAHLPLGYMISVPSKGKVAGFLLGLRQDGAEPGGLGALQHIATIAALQRVILEREREVERRQGSELLAELLAGRAGLDMARRLPVGLGDGPLVLTVIAATDPDTTGSLLHYELTDLAVPHLLQALDELLLLTPAAVKLDEVLASVEVIAAGRSRPFLLTESFVLTRRQAATALQRARERGVRFVDCASAPEELDWLPGEPATIAALVERVLGPLLDHDRLHDSQLVRTARTWLEHDRRPKVVAQRLGIHPHTLAYRLRRIAELTGRDLHSPGTAAQLWLALEAAPTESAERPLPRTVLAFDGGEAAG